MVDGIKIMTENEIESVLTEYRSNISSDVPLDPSTNWYAEYENLFRNSDETQLLKTCSFISRQTFMSTV